MRRALALILVAGLSACSAAGDAKVQALADLRARVARVRADVLRSDSATAKKELLALNQTVEDLRRRGVIDAAKGAQILSAAAGVMGALPPVVKVVVVTPTPTPTPAPAPRKHGKDHGGDHKGND